ncbi:MAG: molybdate ABC transporter substrate-binding protein [Chloroflexota bacterium]|nr:molybdate ABC transporter substrate-binding protein [Chloroflexota bacterium]
MIRPPRFTVSLALLVTLLALVVPAIGMTTAHAQGTGWDCAAPVATAPSADASPVAAATDLVPFPDTGGELTVFAAASLTDAFTEVQADLEAANPELSIIYNFAGSQTLVTQLTEGAAADVFASANNTQMTVASDAGVLSGEPETFVRNRLVIVAPTDNPAGLSEPADLAADGLQLVLAQPAVPVGQYARASICLMAADTVTYGDDFVGRVAANVVSEEDDVREVLTKVQLGEADAGIVYVSDAAIAADEVELIDIPDAVNVIATYPIAPVAGGDDALAAAFIAYILSDDGQQTLADFGFDPVP